MALNCAAVDISRGASNNVEVSISSNIVVNFAPGDDLSIQESDDYTKIRMDGRDPYTGFEDFDALDYPLGTFYSIEEDNGEEEVEDGEEGEEEVEVEEVEGEEEEGGDHDLLVPSVGMQFRTAEDAYNFYNAYAGHVGFSVRRHTQNKSRGENVSSVRFCCSKEGWSKSQKNEQKGLGTTTHQKTLEREHGRTRTGCKASIRVKLAKGGGVWQVSVFNDEHNHVLIRSPSKNRNLRSQKNLTKEEKQIILALSDQNVGTSQIMEYLAKRRGGERKLNFKKKDVSNQIAAENRSLIGIDVESTLGYFRRKQKEDPEFFYEIDADDNNVVRHIFWVDGRARRSYLEFGDVVTFDTTYNTNKYCMPLAPFIGANHHRHSIFFGMALIRSEKVKNFTWLFTTWLKAMFGRHPKAIITDQDPAMKKAIKLVFPNTVHRCCQWHVMRKATDHFMQIYKSKPGFKEELGLLIVRSLTVADFESAWENMLDKYELHSNKHLKVMYEKRSEWVPAYFRGTFFAEMCTTQRSESMNSVLKLWLDSHTSIYRFVMKIDSMVEGIWNRESDEDIKNINETPRLWARSIVEQQAREVYTRNNFSLFKEILKETTMGVVIEIERDALYEVRINKNPAVHNWVPVSFKVEVDKSQEFFSCNCKGFEFDGFLCQHALRVLQHVGMEDLPKRYILNRWCKGANDNAKRPIEQRRAELGESEAMREFRRATLNHDYNKLEDLGIISDDIFSYVRSRIGDVIEEVLPMIAKSTVETHAGAKDLGKNSCKDPVPMDTTLVETAASEAEDDQDTSHAQKYLDPPVSQCKGRPKRPARLKPTFEENLARKRSCSYCHVKDTHNIRTCPKRLEDLAKEKDK